jgi:hypothetical protein
MCTGRDPKEQEELRCWVLSGYAIICQEAGASLASWRNHTHCGEALLLLSSWPQPLHHPTLCSTPNTALTMGFLSWFLCPSILTKFKAAHFQPDSFSALSWAPIPSHPISFSSLMLIFGSFI